MSYSQAEAAAVTEPQEMPAVHAVTLGQYSVLA
jgi:hypothetical protein